MKKRVLPAATAAIFFLSAGTAAAQAIPNTTQALYSHLGELAWKLNAVKAADLQLAKPKTVGSIFLTDDWARGTLYMTSSRKLENQLFKYDIEQNQFLLKETEAKEADIKAIDGVIVLGFETDTEGRLSQYLSSINAGFLKSGAPLPGFAKVLVEGDLCLYHRKELYLQKANYNVALNVGEKEDKNVLRDAFYIRKKDGSELFPVKKNRKDNLIYFFDKQHEVEAYIRRHNLKFTEEEDLVKLITYYNSLK